MSKKGYLHQLIPAPPDKDEAERIARAKDNQPIVATGTTITNHHTGEEKTIERIEMVGANHLIYITTDGMRYNNASLILGWHWIE